MVRKWPHEKTVELLSMLYFLILDYKLQKLCLCISYGFQDGAIGIKVIDFKKQNFKKHNFRLDFFISKLYISQNLISTCFPTTKQIECSSFPSKMACRPRARNEILLFEAHE